MPDFSSRNLRTAHNHGGPELPGRANCSQTPESDLMNISVPTPVILGSRSPRRLELLGHLLPQENLHVCSPMSADEEGFDDLQSRDEFESRICSIAQTKLNDVLDQIRRVLIASDRTHALSFLKAVPRLTVVTADTTVVVTGDRERAVALGQPPEDGRLEDTVRHWFRDYFAGQTHEVLSGVCIATCRIRHGELTPDDISTRHGTCSTRISMRRDVEPLLDWYLSTGESRGKAGGYAIQGAASVFVTQVSGSLSNVIGLPLELTRQLLSGHSTVHI